MQWLSQQIWPHQQRTEKLLQPAGSWSFTPAKSFSQPGEYNLLHKGQLKVAGLKGYWSALVQHICTGDRCEAISQGTVPCDSFQKEWAMGYHIISIFTIADVCDIISHKLHKPVRNTKTAHEPLGPSGLLTRKETSIVFFCHCHVRIYSIQFWRLYSWTSAAWAFNQWRAG